MFEDDKSVDKLLLAKKNLYFILLEKDGGKNKSELTDNEIEIMYLLGCDKQIQDYISERQKSDM